MHVGELLPRLLQAVRSKQAQRPDLLIAAWPEVIGAGLAAMTEALSFEEGVLVVKVRNAVLYSQLCSRDKQAIVTMLRRRFPKTEVRDIWFKLS